MTLDDAKVDWDAQTPVWTLSDDDVLALVRSEARRFDRRIRLRDWREMIAGGVGVALIAPVAVNGNTLTRLGVAVLIVGFIGIAIKLHRARRVRGADRTDAPVAEMLRAERAKVEAQIRLLESVLWWYLAPIAIGVVMVFAGLDGPTWTTLGYAAVVGVMAWWIRRLNAYAARERLYPHRDELTRLLAQVSPATDADA
ncbi:MAG TPA: hypothetical protein VFZ21_01510 [Gemmatimonadaceae bacterium]|jgi:hypothetical protein|nr:hypothetical protein [Gemmatimonadaceae bacterium]